MTNGDIVRLAHQFAIDHEYWSQERFIACVRAALASCASEGQEPVAWMTEGKYPSPRFIIGNTDPSGVWKEKYVPLFLHPSAEIAALRERIAGMEKAQAFAGIVLGTYRADLGDLDGFWLQEQAEAHGMIEERTATVRCGEGCACAEVTTFPTSCFFITEAGQTAIDAAKEPK